MKKSMTVVGFIAAFLSILGMVFKIMHWPGAGPMLILGFASFAFFFVPVFGYKLFYEQSGKKSKIAGVVGAIGLDFIVISVLFKIQHWPGAGPALIIGWLFLCIIVFPWMMILKIIESKTVKEKILNISWYLALSLILLGYVFKIMHFPFAGPLLLFGTIFLCFGYLPLASKIYNNDLNRTKLYTRYLLITAFLVQIFLMAMGVSKDILNAFVLVDDGINETAKYLSETNAAYYTRFESYNNENTKLQYQKAQKVKELSDDMYNHIEKLKINLIRACDRVPQEIPDDSLSLSEADAKDNFDIPTFIMIGDPENPKKGAWSGIELKAKIAVYRQDIISMFEGEKKEIMQKTLGLRIDDNYVGDEGENISWEMWYFYRTPLASVITVLSKLQSDVRYAESVTVEFLYNEAEKSAKN